MAAPSNISPVKAQYESLPYPSRDPEDERFTLFRTWLDELPMINHYCFRGKQTFRSRFRALVAGGGTGDATIFLAEQLRHTDAAVVHLDLSAASIDIARRRAQVRGLRNIEWVNDSLLNLPASGLGQFDYVNCAGVLHHLEDPDAGLRALLAVTRAEGALGIGVYAKYGRTAVYQMQSLLRMLNQHSAGAADKIRTAREVLAVAPQSNWFMRTQDLHQDHKLGDAALFDLLLHSQDCAYTVPELYEWFEDRHGLQIQLTDLGRGRSAYVPELAVGPERPQFLETAARMPVRDQYAVGELLRGDIITHSFFATRSASASAPYGDAEYVPVLFHEPVTGPELATLIDRNGNQPFMLNHVHTGVSARLDPGRYGKHVLAHLDGKRTFAEIFARVRNDVSSAPDDEHLFADFRPLFDLLTAIERLLLRHRSVVV